MISKLELVAVALAVAFGVLWVEHDHRVVIEPLTSAESARREASATCPSNDNMPYGAACLAYLKGAAETGERRTSPTAEKATATSIEAPAQLATLAAAPPCSDTDNVPYSASCVKFLSGWLWRPDEESPRASRFEP